MEKCIGGPCYNAAVRILKVAFETNVTVCARSAISVDADLLEKLIFAGPLVDLCVTSEMRYSSSISTFDYEASASFSQPEAIRRSGIDASTKPTKRSGSYRKTAPKVLAGSCIEVKDRRYNAARIRALYESERHPLSRNKPSS
jgi:hypothetical protein